MVRLWMNGRVVDNLAVKEEADYEVVSSDPTATATMEHTKAGLRFNVSMTAEGLQTAVVRKIDGAWQSGRR